MLVARQQLPTLNEISSQKFNVALIKAVTENGFCVRRLNKLLFSFSALGEEHCESKTEMRFVN